MLFHTPAAGRVAKLVYPGFQIDGGGNRSGIVAARGSYHSYSANTNCTQKL